MTIGTPTPGRANSATRLPRGSRPTRRLWPYGAGAEYARQPRLYCIPQMLSGPAIPGACARVTNHNRSTPGTVIAVEPPAGG
jgi:hypothetical protein